MFKAIRDMIGSLVRKPGDPLVFHTGGVFKDSGLRPDEFPAILHRGKPWLFPNEKLRFGGRMEDDLAQRRNSKPVVFISVTGPFTEKTRKRPITGDMVQMCQDLGIEPIVSFEDYKRQLQKIISDSMGLTFEQLRGHWAR